MNLEGLSHTYPGSRPVAALRSIDLQILDGDYLAIQGASGSGKSTLLNVVGLLDRPTAGTYELGGMVTSSLSDMQLSSLRARFIGFIFQAAHLIPYRTVIENVELAATYTGADRVSRSLQAVELLTGVGLQHRALAKATTLSGGEAQRAALARALMNHPGLLLCDEPTGSLDSANGAVVMALLKRVNDSGQTVVIVTHNNTVAAEASRGIALKDGQIIDQWTADG